VATLRQMVAVSADPWTRASQLHVTGSALVVHPPTRRVLLRWHERQQAWLQVGGHADPGETDPFQIARREAREETGLQDLVAWPDPDEPQLVQVVIVPVPPGKGEPAHEHGDIRYLLATAQPEAAVAESASAELAWLTLDDAFERVAEENLRTCLVRIRGLFQTAQSSS
jgi:8-oxo-dGTP pyrophosphatase MutT (NUDIX family)